MSAIFLPMMFRPVPQVGQEPLMMGFPFFVISSRGAVISRFSRHLTQYACMHFLLRRPLRARDTLNPFLLRIASTTLYEHVFRVF